MSFIKNKEDFVCLKCGTLNKGDGYTNHCSQCLWSLHVDIEPGDRLNKCCGLMKPVYISYTNKDKYLIHRCQKCDFSKRNIIQKNDSIDTMCEIQKNLDNR